MGGKLLALALTLVLALGLAACGGGDGGESGGTVTAAGPSGFRTRSPGVLTVGTELPNPPFVLGDDLDHLKGGFEVDMVDEIADRLGVERVEWVGFPFTKLVAGDRCPCDFAVNGVSILPDRRQRVDFSSPYFTANQGVLVRKGTPSPGSPTPAGSTSVSRRPPLGRPTWTGSSSRRSRPGPSGRPRPRSRPCGPAGSTPSCPTSRSWSTRPPSTLG